MYTLLFDQLVYLYVILACTMHERFYVSMLHKFTLTLTLTLNTIYNLNMDTATCAETSSQKWTWMMKIITNVFVTDLTIRQPGFHLSHFDSSLTVHGPMLNHFQTGRGRCLANLHKCGLATSDLYTCSQWQTLYHTVDPCALTKREGSLQSLHDTVYRLKNKVTTAVTK